MTIQSTDSEASASALSTLTTRVVNSVFNTQGSVSMTAEQFAYWLQGFAELNNGAVPNETQWRSINDHLQTVFKKVTPYYSSGGITTSPGQSITTLSSVVC
jgi:hypothetical protein